MGRAKELATLMERTVVDDPSCLGHVLLYKPELNENDDLLEKSENDFNPTEMHLWPVDDTPI